MIYRFILLCTLILNVKVLADTQARKNTKKIEATHKSKQAADGIFVNKINGKFAFSSIQKENGFSTDISKFRFIPLANMSSEGFGYMLFAFVNKRGWDIATLAGGCFWGMEELLHNLPGVLETRVGYTGGFIDNATYNEVKTGKSGHAEAVQVLFDPAQLSYENILLLFFNIHDPTTLAKQGNDIGSQYRSAIFYNGTNQKETAQKIIERVNKSKLWGKPVVTEINPLGNFWVAEDFHQQYLKKNPKGYTCHFDRRFNF